jgi:hypothetical protein
MSNNQGGGDRQNYVRRQFDDAQRSRMDVEGFWKSSRGSLTAIIGVGVIAVAAVVSIVFSFIPA